MKQHMPHTPFATRLSGSAKEIELRLRSIFQWKKKRPPVVFLILSAMAALLCGGLVSCETKEPDCVFDSTKEIAAVTIHTTVNDLGEIEVPGEHLEEISQWLNRFQVGKAAGDALSPGAGSTSVTVTYADGTTVDQSISTVKRDKTQYYIDAPDAPECWTSLFSASR